MAFFTFHNKKVLGIVSSTSSEKISIEELGAQSNLSVDEIKRIKETTGVEQVFRNAKLTTSDYCINSAEYLMQNIGWDPSEVDVLIFLTQTPDYILPKTSTIIQHKLGLRQDIFTLDINDGCSGFVYGLVTALSFCSTNLKKVLLLMGETPSKQVNIKDKSANLLFGDGGCAIAITFDETYMDVCTISQGVDGSNSEAIIIPDGGYRNVYSANSLIESNVGGLIRNKINLFMNGQDVFLFGITKVPQVINEFISEFKIDLESIDFFIMHQANRKMNEMISKKVKIVGDRVLYSIDNFGNTSSLSIPLTLVHNKNKLKSKTSNLLCSGFGVGLSWGVTNLRLEEDIILKHLYING
jgi:3-oxoacyl-[acyl-carrier-protein] synthase-3